MKIAILCAMVLILPLLLAACGGAAAAPQSAAPVAAEPQSAGNAMPADYQDALPAAAQLILGSLQLEEGDLAITSEEATQLLPLWQAYRSLSTSDTTAAAELEAIVRQIQGAMSAEQVAAIAAMQLTTADISEAMQAFGPGLGGLRDGTASASGGVSGAGGGPPGGGMFPGTPPDGGPGGPGGGPDGGGPDGGRPGGGVFGGAGGEQLSPGQRATAIAERMAENPGLAADFATRGILNQLITTLQLKTGEVTQEQLRAQQGQREAMRWVGVASEATGIAVEKINEAMRGGKTLSEAIQAEGGDVAEAEAAIREILKNAPNADEKTLEEEITAALNATAPEMPPPSQ